MPVLVLQNLLLKWQQMKRISPTITTELNAVPETAAFPASTLKRFMLEQQPFVWLTVAHILVSIMYVGTARCDRFVRN